LTEIPEHLLRRSRERRAALGLSSGSGDESGPSGGEAAVAPAAPSGAERAAAPARAGASTEVATAPPPGVPAVPQEPGPTYIAPPRGPHKSKIPIWVMPVLIVIPLWAFLYPGAFTSHKKTVVTDPLVLGQQVYTSAGCSGCHGATGGGGVGPALHGGQSKLTFPNVQDQINWVKNGSISLAPGTKYGDPNRPGGQRVAKADMPAFGSTLSPAQIQDVVQYEREKL
jgi:mono/diheme cytochrome c family protein